MNPRGFDAITNAGPLQHRHHLIVGRPRGQIAFEEGAQTVDADHQHALAQPFEPPAFGVDPIHQRIGVEVVDAQLVFSS